MPSDMAGVVIRTASPLQPDAVGYPTLRCSPLRPDMAGAPLDIDPYFSFVTLLMHWNGEQLKKPGNAEVWDSSKYARQKLAGGSTNQLRATQALFSNVTSLYYFSGSDRCTFAVAPELGFSTNDFTVEQQLWPESLGLVGSPWQWMGQDDTFAVAGRWTFGSDAAGTQRGLSWYANGSPIVTTAVNVLNISAWNQVAYSRVAGIGYLFCNQVLVASGPDPTVYTAAVQLSAPIGGFAGGNGVHAYHAEVRITNGVGRYSDTVPQPLQTAPWPNQ